MLNLDNILAENKNSADNKKGNSGTEQTINVTGEAVTGTLEGKPKKLVPYRLGIDGDVYAGPDFDKVAGKSGIIYTADGDMYKRDPDGGSCLVDAYDGGIFGKRDKKRY